MDVNIETNKTAYIVDLHQSKTYSGLLEGLPTKRLNQQIINDTRIAAKYHCGIDEIYVIEAEQRPIDYKGKYPFGEPAELPGIRCIAKLRCHSIFYNGTKDYSLLTIVWFQNEYAFPIDTDILEKIKIIPFSKFAGNFFY